MKYKKAGVDVDENEYITEQYKKIARKSTRKEVMSGVGLFSGVFDFSAYKNHLLVCSTDGVGTKTMIASVMQKFDTIGYDIVNHSINDILTSGATPLLFLDYLASNTLTPEQKIAVVKSIARACRKYNIALIGGETADMPDLYPKNEFDLAGTIIGAVKKHRLITGKTIEKNDVLLGLPSNGLHTNGYSLVRSIFKLQTKHNTPKKQQQILLKHHAELGTTLGNALLVPHTSYYNELYPHLKRIKAVAHITGGGIEGNVSRIIPKNMCAIIRCNAWEIPSLFQLIQKQGNVSTQEMYRVFNMGIGMVVVASQKNADALLKNINNSFIIGHIDTTCQTTKQSVLLQM